MKREGFKKNKYTIHGHNECGICSGNFNSKNRVKQLTKKEIKEQLDLHLTNTDDIYNDGGHDEAR